jgi:hypothetical protein
MAKEPRIRGKGFENQRGNGWFVMIDVVLPELIKRLDVRGELQVFLRAYAIQYPGERAGSLEVRRLIRGDLETFYNGGQLPRYVFDTYTYKFPPRLIAAE